MGVRPENINPQNLKNDLGALRVRNSTGATISKGTAVRLTGKDGLLTVTVADQTDGLEDVWFAASDILGTGAATQRYTGVVQRWLIFTMDTSASSVGAGVYLSSTGAPTLSAIGPKIGKVLTVSATGDVLLEGSGSGVVEVTGTIPAGGSAGQVGYLATAPYEVLAAPGSGLAWAFDEGHLFLDYGSAAYDGTVTGNAQFRYTSGSGDAVSGTIPESGFADATSDQARLVRAVSVTPAANAPVVLEADNDWYSASGDSPIKYRVRAHIVAIDPTA